MPAAQRKGARTKTVEAPPLAAYQEKEPTELHVKFAEWITEKTGYEVDLKSVQLATALRMPFQASPENQEHLEERRKRAEQAVLDREAAAKEREEKRVANAAKAQERAKALEAKKAEQKAEREKRAAEKAAAPAKKAAAPTAVSGGRRTSKATAKTTPAKAAPTSRRRQPAKAAASKGGDDF